MPEVTENPKYKADMTMDEQKRVREIMKLFKNENHHSEHYISEMLQYVHKLINQTANKI